MSHTTSEVPNLSTTGLFFNFKLTDDNDVIMGYVSMISAVLCEPMFGILSQPRLDKYINIIHFSTFFRVLFSVMFSAFN